MIDGYQFIRYSKKNGAATIVLDDPRRLNPLSGQMQRELKQVLSDVEGDDDVRVAVIVGAGDRAFSVGADIALFEGLDSTVAYELMRKGYEIHRQLERIEKPFIAAVNGYCLAGGLELALACDFIIATETAVFGAPEVSLGIMPGWGGTVRLPRAIPSRMARELIYTGDTFGAAEAQRLGLVNRVVPPREFDNAVQAVVAKILRQPPLAVRMAKVSINSGLETADVDAALVTERGLISVLYGTNDCREAVNAFVAKRRAKTGG